jgi:hypothetical protein
MKTQLSRIFAFSMLVLTATTGFGRGINDGTLPLKLDGTSRDVSPGAGNPIATTVDLLTSRLASAAEARQIACLVPSNNLKYVVTGTIIVGGVNYGVRAICTNASDDNIEVFAVASHADLRISGALSVGQVQSQIDGRMQIGGANLPQGRYVIRVTAPSRILP